MPSSQKQAGGWHSVPVSLFINRPQQLPEARILLLHLKGIYEINMPFHLSPSFTVFYPHVTKVSAGKTSVSSMMFDINGHYVFNSLDKFELYGLAGLDILFARMKISNAGSPTFTESDNAMGINLGIGTYLKITEQVDINSEVKYIFNNKYNQFMLNVGILLNIEQVEETRKLRYINFT